MASPVDAGPSKKTGLVLSGGGARGAYQAGAVKAIIELAQRAGVRRPLPILSGVSAGAINAALLASLADDPPAACARMCALWSSLSAERVFRTDVLSTGASGLRFVTDATFGALYTRKLSRSLLDTTPLSRLLAEAIPLTRIDELIQKGHLDALVVTAMNYVSATSVAYVQGREGLPSSWHRARHRSERTTITVDHIKGSAAIPIFFQPVRIGDDHLGDGCLRNPAPLSPAIRLGAERLFVVSVQHPEGRFAQAPPRVEPSVARIFGIILNGILLDSLEADMERLNAINQELDLIPNSLKSELKLRKIENLWIRPSKDLSLIAGAFFHRMPRVIRYLLSGLGTPVEAAELASYLLFDPEYCGTLLRLGYDDAMAHKEGIMRFLTES